MVKTDTQTEIKRLEKKLKDYQQKYNELAVQSPTRWWHDEHFDNQLKLYENMIAKTKKQIEELKKTKSIR